jgi:hypothetical protein
MTKDEIYFYHGRAFLSLTREGAWSCFYCESHFPGIEAVDEGSDSWHCPNCKLDTAIPFDLTPEQLGIMNNYWFHHGRECLRGEDGQFGDKLGPTVCYAKTKPCHRCDILKEVDDER